MVRRASAALVLICLLAPMACEPHRDAGAPSSDAPAAGDIRLDRSALFPESVVFDEPRDRFIVGSFREGALYAADRAGHTRLLVDDPRLVSVLGVGIDTARSRVLAANADLGVAEKKSAGGPRTLAALGVYDLIGGFPIRFVDLGALLPDRKHLANGLTVDAGGTAYVTDSFASAIYAIPPDGDPIVLAQVAAFDGEGIGLNGLVAHPDGYLLVVKKNDGKLFRVPVSGGTPVEEVALPRPLVGADGVVLLGPEKIAVISNEIDGRAANEVVTLSSHDHWRSARIVDQRSLGRVYPTCGVLAHGRFFVMHGNLNDLLQSKPDTRDGLRNVTMLEFLREPPASSP